MACSCKNTKSLNRFEEVCTSCGLIKKKKKAIRSNYTYKKSNSDGCLHIKTMYPVKTILDSIKEKHQGRH